MDDRREEDPRITQLMFDVNQLKFQMAENTVVTVEVRDLLSGIKLLLSISKWGAAIGASLVGIWASIKGFNKL